MAVLSEADLVKAFRNKAEQAIADGSERSQNYAKSLNLFLNGPTGTEAADHSDIVSADVNSMVTAVLAQMIISFSTDQVVKFGAESAADEQAAKAESLACNRVVARSGGVNVIRDGVQNALLFRNGYIKAWWDKDVNNYKVRHEGIERADLPIATEKEQGIDRKLVSYDEDKKTAVVEVTETTMRLRVAAVAADRFFMDGDWDQPTLQGCPLAGEVHYKTRNDLVRMGASEELVNQIPAVMRNSGVESRARKSAAVDPISKSMEICRVYEGYAWYSKDDEDDRAYLFKCWTADAGEDKWLIEPEIVSRTPYACGSAFPIANRHEGESLADKLAPIQAGKTEMWRQWIDNVRVNTYGRFGVVVGQVNQDDVMTPKAGSPVRLKSATALVPIPVMDVGASIKMALEEFDKARTERGGAAIDMVGAEMQVANDTAHGTERVYAGKELLVSYMTRNVAESLIVSLFLLVHAELRDGDGGPISYKVGDQWATVDPATWKARDEAIPTVGYSMGERMHMSAIYGQVLGLYQTAMANGLDGILVSTAGLYKLIVDWMALNLIDGAEGYFIDPESEAAKAAGQAKQQQAEQQAQQTQMQQEALLTAPEKVKAGIKQYEVDQKTFVDMFKAVLDAQAQDASTEAENVRTLIAARTESDAATNDNAGNRPAGKVPGGKSADSDGGDSGARPAKAKRAAKSN